MTTISADHKCVVDVRDAARAHLLAVKKANAANRRYILCHSSPSFQTYAAPVAAKYRKLGWPITKDLGTMDPYEYIVQFDNPASKDLGIVYTHFT